MPVMDDLRRRGAQAGHWLQRTLFGAPPPPRPPPPRGLTVICPRCRRTMRLVSARRETDPETGTVVISRRWRCPGCGEETRLG